MTGPDLFELAHRFLEDADDNTMPVGDLAADLRRVSMSLIPLTERDQANFFSAIGLKTDKLLNGRWVVTVWNKEDL